MREEQIQYYLGVQGPIAGIVEYEYAIDLDRLLGIIRCVFPGRELSIREGTSVGFVILW